MTPATWLLGYASGLLLVGLAGIVSAVGGHVPGWDDLYFYLPILVTGTAIGWIGGAALEFQLWHERQSTNLRIDQARAWSSELANREREARLEQPAEVESDDADTDLQRAWALALDRFFRAGDAAGGFSIRRLDGVVGSDTWGQLVHFYGGTAGGNVLRDAGGDVGYTWGHGWSLDRVTMALHAGRLPCPDMPVPVVQPYVANKTQRNSKRQPATVIQGN